MSKTRPIALLLNKEVLALSLFFLGLFAVVISIFFDHTRGLWYVGNSLLFIALILKFKDLISLLRSHLKITGLLLSFLFFLFLAVLYSPNFSTSLDRFLLNYFFNVVLFFNLWLFWEKFYAKPFWFWLFWGGLFSINAVANIYFLVLSIFSCKTNFSCYVFWGLTGIHQSFLHDLVSSSTVYMFFPVLFLTFFLCYKNRARWLFLGLSLTNLFFLLWFGRRAALLGLLVGFFVSGLFFSRFKKMAFALLSLCILIVGAIFLSPYGKSMFIRSDKIEILLSGDYERFKGAGSLGLRLYAWPFYLEAALESPFKGTGLSRKVQKRVLSEVVARSGLSHAHNLFLNLWLQAGIQTALLFLLFHLYLLRFSRTSAQKFCDEPHFFVFAGMFVFLVAFLVASLFEGLEKLTKFVPFWLAAGILVGHRRYLERPL